jgi:thymidine kinase
MSKERVRPISTQTAMIFCGGRGSGRTTQMMELISVYLSESRDNRALIVVPGMRDSSVIWEIAERIGMDKHRVDCTTPSGLRKYLYSKSRLIIGVDQPENTEEGVYQEDLWNLSTARGRVVAVATTGYCYEHGARGTVAPGSTTGDA